MQTHHLTPAQARRIAVQAQRLDRERPADLLDLVDHLTLLQIDATAAVAPSADLVAWSRLGASYAREELAAALTGHALVDPRGMIRPAQDIALYRAHMAQWGTGNPSGWQRGSRDWVEANDAGRRDILARLDARGPTLSRELPDGCVVPWASTGWTNNRNVTQLLEFMVVRGEVAVAARKGNDRWWDLASRVYPDDPVVPADDALRLRNERRLHSLGIARSRTTQCPVEPNDVGDVGEPADIDGVAGQWRVDPSYLGQPFTGRTALLSPFDRLLFDRKRMDEIFAFDYQVEIYKPAAKRRWGFYALPILHGDSMVGKVDATADRKAGVLRVDAIHQDVPFTDTMTANVLAEIGELGHWLDLDVVVTC